MGFYYQKSVKFGGHHQTSFIDRRPFPLSLEEKGDVVANCDYLSHLKKMGAVL